MAYVPQGLGLFPHLRAEDNLAFGLPRVAVSRERLRDFVRALRALGTAPPLSASTVGRRAAAGRSGARADK